MPGPPALTLPSQRPTPYGPPINLVSRYYHVFFQKSNQKFWNFPGRSRATGRNATAVTTVKSENLIAGEGCRS